MLRSPTFTIENESIHFRVAGKNASIRVVVEGHLMAEYNDLLFKGLSFDLAGDRDSNGFEWRVMSGDLKLQKGHRAYIEITDHGDGWVAVDEIRFSDDATPRNPAPEFAITIAETLADFSASQSETAIDPAVDPAVAAMTGTVLQALAEGGQDRGDVMSWIVEHDLGELFESESNDGAIQECVERLKGLREQTRTAAGIAPAPVFAPAITEGTVEDEFVLIRGNHKTPGPIVPRGFLTALVADASVDDSVVGSGRRELAERIASVENPLTTRVIVNRLWHHLTGRGIVASVDNFGVLGSQPTHPELLDHLATEFATDGWSLKRMIRRIVLSRTYQMASDASDRNQENGPSLADIDPDNLLLHRANVRRITAQSIRDSMLAVSGQLNEKRLVLQ